MLSIKGANVRGMKGAREGHLSCDRGQITAMWPGRAGGCEDLAFQSSEDIAVCRRTSRQLRAVRDSGAIWSAISALATT